MSAAARIWFALAVFLAVTGLVYGLTSHELAGAMGLLVCSATFGALALVARVWTRAEPDPAEAGPEEPPHAPPTVWPVGFAIAAVLLAIGLAVAHWLLIPGIGLFAASGVGWYGDVRAAHRGHEPDRV